MQTIAAFVISWIHYCSIRAAKSRASPLAVSLETLLCHAWMMVRLGLEVFPVADWSYFAHSFRLGKMTAKNARR